ncbi:hypothetical protein [Blattabacterium cuenoti]|uniref:hypothetical protein n=1 Tax=Blattabacterium cuenoti TaxID=1653831 RepID=UPI00163B9DAD|nr:hypothetical protein [Blattabacterium cuenoti]
MNTSFRLLIPTIFLMLGLIISCSDDITSAGEEESGIKNNTSTTGTTSSVPNSPSTTVATTTPAPSETPPTDSTKTDTDDDENPKYSFKMEDIDPEDLSRQIKEIREKIEKLEQENTKNFDEYDKMAEIQKGILEKVRKKKMIMRSKPVGSEEQVKAQKDFEDQKKFGKEKFKILKEKNILLNKLTKTLTEAKNEEIYLQKKQEFFLKNSKKETKN